MIEHWYEALPAAWAIPEVRWYILISVVILITLSYLLGYFMGMRRK